MTDRGLAASDRRRILIVDGERVIRESMRAILEREGYDVMSEATAESGLTTAQTWPPDVLIAEIILPGSEGMDFAISIAKTYPQCRIILLAAQVAQFLIDKAVILGFDFFYKPVAPAVILARLKVLLDAV